MFRRPFRIFTIAVLSGLLLSSCEQSGTPEQGYKPRWQSIVEIDPVNGSASVQMMVAAVDRSPSEQHPVALVLSCLDRSTDVYVIWRQYMGVYDVDVSWRVDSEETIEETWSLSTDNEATFAPQPLALIKRMMVSEQFQIKAAPFGSSPVTHVFDITGLKREVNPLLKACGLQGDQAR